MLTRSKTQDSRRKKNCENISSICKFSRIACNKASIQIEMEIEFAFGEISSTHFKWTNIAGINLHFEGDLWGLWMKIRTHKNNNIQRKQNFR